MYGISSCTTLTAPAVYTVVRVPNKASVPHWGHFHCSFTLVDNKYSNVVHGKKEFSIVVIEKAVGCLLSKLCRSMDPSPCIVH